MLRGEYTQVLLIVGNTRKNHHSVTTTMSSRKGIEDSSKFILVLDHQIMSSRFLNACEDLLGFNANLSIMIPEAEG